MRLVRARVTNFKSIDDSGWVTFEQETCLVGKNESGKTAFLQALEKISPVEASAGDFDVLDYPRKHYVQYRQVHSKTPAVVVRAEFELTPEELKEIESEFATGLLTSRKVTYSKDYANKLSLDMQMDEAPMVKSLIEKAGLPADTAGIASTAKTIDDLQAALEGIPDAPPSVNALSESVRDRFKTTLSTQVEKKLESLRPRFVYFDEYSTMQGRISVQDMRQRQGKGEGSLTNSDRTFLALLSLVGAKLQDLENEKNYERVKAELEAASINITDEVFRFWSQNKQLEVEFDLSPANPADSPPLNAGTILHVRIKNNRHRVSVPFDQRSRGFVWFFSFLVYFSQIEDKGYNLLLLLDEPGLSLHAKAQNDFLRFIDERLGSRHQVIYSTHSPFMVNPAHFERVRTVQDLDEKGTVLSDNVLRNDRDTVFPLQAALGYELAQTLFLGPNCLLVDGPSDLIYLPFLSEAARVKGSIQLDSRWVIVPTGGADKVATFVSLLGANKLNVAVLMDVGRGSRQRIENLQTIGLLSTSNIVPISEATMTKEADIEDIFDPQFYVDLVNATYAKDLPTPIALAALPLSSPRITKRIEELFKSAGIAAGEFSHYRPALHLLAQQANLLAAIDDATIGRASKLFERVNALLVEQPRAAAASA